MESDEVLRELSKVYVALVELEFAFKVEYGDSLWRRERIEKINNIRKVLAEFE